MKKKYKKEKYISEKENKHGTSFQICIPYNADGKRKYYTETIEAWKFPSDRVAFDFAKKRRDIALLNLTAPVSLRPIPTVSELFERRFELSGMSIENYNRTKSLFKSSLQKFGNISLSEIKASDIQSALVEYAETHTQPCVNRVYSIWKKIFETAQMDEYNVTNKMLSVQIPKARKVISKKQTSITKKDFDAFCNALLSSDFLNKEIHWNILQVMYYTGMRPSEVFALTADDIDFKNNRITVSKAVGSTSDSRREIIRVKTQDSIRMIPIVPQLESILRNCIPASSSELLFKERDGSPIDVKHFSHDIAIISKRCGIPFNAYMLRHLFSTDLFAMSENPITIKALMGHSSINMSAYYANATEDDKKDALNRRK